MMWKKDWSDKRVASHTLVPKGTKKYRGKPEPKDYDGDARMDKDKELKLTK